MISFVIFLEKPALNGGWHGVELCDLNEAGSDIDDRFIGHNSIYPFFGYNVGRSSPQYLEYSVKKLPFVQEIPKHHSDEFDFDLDYSPGMFLLEDAFNFDYDQIAYKDITYRAALTDAYFDMINLAKEHGFTRILYYFT